MLPRIKCDTSSRELGNLSQSQQSGKYGDTDDRHDLFTPNHSRSALSAQLLRTTVMMDSFTEGV